jgi:hydrogenase nickel incorporation protein HypA/HybF
MYCPSVDWQHEFRQSLAISHLSVLSCSNRTRTVVVVMHEHSLVRSLIRQVEQVALDNAADAIERVRVELGPLSGVEPVLVDLAWRQLAPGTMCNAAALTLVQISLRCRCRACGEDFEVPEIRLECPGCGLRSVQVTGGDEFRLLDVTIRERIPVEERAS